MAELEKFYENSFQDIVEGEITKGKIVSISDDHVVLDVGFKSDGSIPRNEFAATDELEIGGEVDIVIESVENKEGNLVLSKKRADFLKIWDRIMNAHETEEVLQGKILKRISIIQAHPSGPGAKPKIAMAILQDGPGIIIT